MIFKKEIGVGVISVCSLLLFIAWNSSCRKTSEASSNRANLSVTNIIYSGQPVDILYQEVKITDSGKIATDSTTGMPGYPYLNVVAGTSNFKATPDGTSFWIDGNISLITNSYYSVFLYDTVKNGKAASLVLKDVLNAPPDTISAIRFLNFSPDTLTVVFTNAMDTFYMSSVPKIDSTSSIVTLSTFQSVKQGDYSVLAIKDSVTGAFTDSIHLSGGKIYSLFTRGRVAGSGGDSLYIQTILHN